MIQINPPASHDDTQTKMGTFLLMLRENSHVSQKFSRLPIVWGQIFFLSSSFKFEDAIESIQLFSSIFYIPIS